MKKLLTIIALSLVGLIGVTVITLAFVKTDYNQVSTANVDEIVVTYNSKQGTFDESNYDEIYADILEEFASGTKETVLSSLFQGAYSATAEPEIVKESWTDSSLSGMIIKFNYNSANYPTITLKGKNYIDETTETTVQYGAVYIIIENNSTLTTLTAYFAEIEEEDESFDSGNYQVKFVAHTDALYDYILDLEENDYII